MAQASSNGDGRSAERGQGADVEAQQVDLVGPAVLEVHPHGEEVAHVAEGRADVDDAPVEEADAVAVEEEVAEVRVAVDDGAGRPRATGPAGAGVWSV